jgi:hypothetical protein
LVGFSTIVTDMNCIDVRDNLEDYLTDETHVSVAPLIRDHIWDCHDCAIEAKRTRTVLRAVTEGLRTSDQAPSDFAALVVARINSRGRHRGLHALSRSAMYMLALISVTALFTAAIVGLRARQERSPRPNVPLPVTALSVSDIARFYGGVESPGISHSVETSSPSMIATALSSVTGFEVEPVDLSRQGANATSGCTTTIAGTEAACTNYVWNGVKVSLLQMPATLTLPTLTVTQIGSRTVLIGGSPSCRMAIWRSVDSIFVLVGDIPDLTLMRMVQSVPEVSVGDREIYDERSLE